ncbi:MAG: carbon storage regulator CsrA [Planctomycetes bacterium]|nr:carbon storage regulator CsrA [Planctomycetota bacterium]
MLVLSRKIGERIVIEPGIEIEIVEVRGGKVRIGIEAPQDIRIYRSEVAERILPELSLTAPAHSR